MKRVLAAVLGAGLLLAGCGQQSTPAAVAAPGPYADGLDHSWTASTAEGQRLYTALSQGLKSQDFNIGLSVTATSGYGPIELNTSNGEFTGGDGKPITLNGKVYSTGLGVHANSEIHIQATNLQTPACTRFQADVGVDDEVGDKGSVVFEVFANGLRVFDSGVMTGASATQHIDVGIGNASDLRFVVTDAFDNNYYDHADWAGAVITCLTSPSQPQTNRPVVTGISGNQEQVDTTRQDSSGNTLRLPTKVTVTGQNLQNATSVQFGSDFGTPYFGTDIQVNADGTQLTVMAPVFLRMGKDPIVITTPTGKVNAGTYSYFQQETFATVHLLSISPISGPSSGGTVIRVAIDGNYSYTADLQKVAIPDVYFGTTKASSVSLDSAGNLSAVAPAGVGQVDVTLQCASSCRTYTTTESVPFTYLP